MFAFLVKRCRVSNRTWRAAIPKLEALVLELGAEGGWREVERIATASQTASNQGAYVYACLFPDGSPEREGPLPMVERDSEPGPLFQGGGAP